MAILELVVQQSYYNQLVVNRYHYISSGTPASVTPSFALCYATGYIASRVSAGLFPNATLAGQVQGMQTSGVQTIAAYARNLYSNTDFYESPFPTPPVGINGGEGLSPAVAYGFYASRVRTDIRRGMKRIVGVSESSQSAGGTITGSSMPALVNIAGQLGATLTYDDEGNTITLVPCILGLEEYTTPSGKRAYRPYATEAAQLAHVAQGMTWTPYTSTRTQVSRQYGRGA